MDILLLTTPIQHADTNPAVLLQPKLLQAWCETLPTMNVIETVNMLKQAIYPFNELKINPNERLKLLEIYRNTFEEILSSYDELRLRTLPIPPEQRKIIAEDIMWLYLDLANGYKIIVKESSEKRENIKNNSSILTAVYRAMELLLTSLIYAIKAHAEIPQLVMLEIKQLYLFAESNNVIENRIKTIKDRLSPATVGNLFKQFILLCTLKKNVLPSEDILQFFTLLDNFTTQTNFISQKSTNRNQFIYKIELIDDEFPVKIDDIEKHSLSEMLRFIDIQSALDTMEAILQQKKSAHENTFIENKENQLLKLYLESLNPSSLTADHKNTTKRIKLVNGIETVHFFLEHISEINELFTSEKNSGIEVQSISFDEQLLQKISDWNLIEESDTARILTSETNLIQEIPEINSFVALIQPMKYEQAPLVITGIVKKIRETEDNHIKIGIEILPGHPVPFSYLHRNGKESIESGLYFPPLTSLKIPASLLIKKNNFKNDMNCAIRINKQEILVQPTDTIRETNDITQFNFSKLN